MIDLKNIKSTKHYINKKKELKVKIINLEKDLEDQKFFFSEFFPQGYSPSIFHTSDFEGNSHFTIHLEFINKGNMKLYIDFFIINDQLDCEHYIKLESNDEENLILFNEHFEKMKKSLKVLEQNKKEITTSFNSIENLFNRKKEMSEKRREIQKKIDISQNINSINKINRIIKHKKYDTVCQFRDAYLKDCNIFETLISLPTKKEIKEGNYKRKTKFNIVVYYYLKESVKFQEFEIMNEYNMEDNTESFITHDGQDLSEEVFLNLANNSFFFNDKRIKKIEDLELKNINRNSIKYNDFILEISSDIVKKNVDNF